MRINFHKLSKIAVLLFRITAIFPFLFFLRLQRRADKFAEQRVRTVRAASQLRMILHAVESPGLVADGTGGSAAR